LVTRSGHLRPFRGRSSLFAPLRHALALADRGELPASEWVIRLSKRVSLDHVGRYVKSVSHKWLDAVKCGKTLLALGRISACGSACFRHVETMASTKYECHARFHVCYSRNRGRANAHRGFEERSTFILVNSCEYLLTHEVTHFCESSAGCGELTPPEERFCQHHSEGWLDFGPAELGEVGCPKCGLRPPEGLRLHRCARFRRKMSSGGR